MGTLHHIHEHPDYRCYFDPPEENLAEIEAEIDASLAMLEKEGIPPQGPNTCDCCRHREDMRPRWRRALFEGKPEDFECAALRTPGTRDCTSFNPDGLCPFFQVALVERTVKGR